ncbi:MAG: Ig domain-containing protein [Verrucomicrobiota bacterium]
MQQIIKRFLWMVLLVSGLPAAWGFSPAGPIGSGPQGNPKPAFGLDGDAWQTPTIGYGLTGDTVAPKNIGQEYRHNTPVMYYTYADNFLEFFDANNTTNGTAAVDGAFAILNALTNVDRYSPQLSEFPLNSQKFNFSAQALGLTDLKSTALYFMMEQLGLAEPERYVWTLHDRNLPGGGTCPLDEEYVVVQRNLDPVSKIYSSYINGTLYTFEIEELCNPPVPPDALAIPFPVDPLADTFTAVAGLGDGLALGGFYTGLTRDDVGGLRYLLSTNNIVTEDPATGSLLTTATTNLSSNIPFPANPNSPSDGFGTFNLGALLAASITNDPVTLETLFPGVIVASTETNLAIVTNFTVVAFFTNFISSAAGNPPTLVITTNAVRTFEEVFTDTFANIVTNHYFPNTFITLQTVTVGPLEGAASQVIVTNTKSTKIPLLGPNGAAIPSGDYYILNLTNQCGLDIVNSNFLSNIVAVTNTSAIFGTNAAGATNSTTSFSFTQVITFSTNYVFEIHPVTCTQTADATGLYGGVGKIQFIRADFDSIAGQFFQPITNNYTVMGVTNSQFQSFSFQRIVTVPDILFSAGDLATPNPDIIGAGELTADRTVPNWDVNNVGAGLDGPGTINPPATIVLSDTGDAFFSGGLAAFGLGTNQFLMETNTTQLLAWGSFDASTNPPVVYPDAAALTNLQNQMVIQVSPTSLPEGTNGTFYGPITFTATGGAFTAPFTWSALPVAGMTGSGLPAGLILSSAGVLSGSLSGNPAGTYDFTLQLTDVIGRSVQFNYSIIIQ